MRFLLLGLSLFVAAHCIAADTTYVLFAGNSQTVSGGSTVAFEELSKSLGKTVYVREYVRQGAGLRTFLHDSAFHSMLQSNRWEYVVLQPGMGESSAGVNPLVALALRDSIYKHLSCDTHVLFYELGRSPSSYASNALPSFNIRQDAILDNITEASVTTDLYFAPAGEAIRLVYNRDLEPFFWISDQDHHLNGIGGYAAACVFYCTIFLESCEGASYIRDLDPQVARKLQVAADETVLPDPAKWRIGVTTQLETDFSYTHSNYRFTFTNLSNSHEPVRWDFGNGITSTAKKPELTLSFEEQSAYTITLYTRIRCQTDQKTMVIHKEDLQNFHFEVSPNPTTGTLIISQEMEDPDAALSIYDLSGSLVWYQLLGEHVQTISIASLPPGTYLMKIKNASGSHERMIQLRN